MRESLVNDIGGYSPLGIRKITQAFETNDFSAIKPAFGDNGLDILKRWWHEEELAVSCLLGDFWSYVGVFGEEAILDQAKHACFSPKTKVLDVGCGIGGPGRILARTYGCHVHGIDINSDAVIIASGLSKVEGLEKLTTFEVGDRNSLPVNDYDIIWGHGAWGLGEDLKKAWAEAFRAAKSGARVCSGIVPNEAEFIKNLGFSKVEFYEDSGISKRAGEYFLLLMEKNKDKIVAQSSEQIWNMFFNQKKKQLENIDDELHLIAVGVK